jgi:hypothetical protein
MKVTAAEIKPSESLFLGFSTWKISVAVQDPIYGVLLYSKTLYIVLSREWLQISKLKIADFISYPLDIS